MGLRFSSGSATHSSSHYRPQYSGSADGEGSLPLPSPHGRILKWPNLKVYSLEELETAVKRFGNHAMAGPAVDIGSPCKAWLDGMVVFIKGGYCNETDSWAFQGWQSEINILASSHPNLVKLLGYCWDDDKLFLVYEFLPEGSLEDYLFGRNPHIEPLSWNTRLKIAIGAARALAFLHTLEKPVIYRDFKSSNILLDGNYNAKISDFGLAIFGPSGGQSHVTTSVLGTYGYADPEYVATGHLCVKSDVYGFGAVLLEILTGMRVLDTNRPTWQHNLVEWSKPYLSSKKKLKTIMDAKIEGQYSPKAALQAAQLTLKCLELDPEQRPSMEEVLEALESIEAIHEKSKESQTHNSHHTSHQPPRQRVVRG